LLLNLRDLCRAQQSNNTGAMRSMSMSNEAETKAVLKFKQH